MSFTAVNLGLLSGGTFSAAVACSSSGSVVVGQADDTLGNFRAVYWDASNVIHELPTLGTNPFDEALGCSPDGTIIIGQAQDNSGLLHAVTWTGGPSWGINDLGFLSGGNSSEALSCSSNGLIVVGESKTTGSGGLDYPAVWTSGVPAVLPRNSGDTSGTATCCSSSGTILFGGSTGTHNHGLTWTGGPSWSATLLPTSAGGLGSYVYGCSANGSIAVGSAANSSNAANAAYWTGTSLTVLADALAGPGSTAFGCDANGTTLGGVSNGGLATVWIAGVGSLLPLATGVTSCKQATAVSGDASTIVGFGLTAGAAQRAIKWTAAASSHFATMADLFFAPTTGFVDFTEPANRRKFIFVNGGAQNLQPDGSGPFAVAPPVFLSVQGGDVPANFPTNQGRGGAFLQSGPALTDGATDPPPVTVSTQSAASSVPFSGVLGDYLTGNIYAFNPDTLTDNGQQRKWVRRWRALPNTTTSAVTFSYLAIDMETGNQVPPGTNPQVVLRWSDDAAKSWSGNRIVPVGATGETTTNVKFNRLGSTTRFSGSTRIFELSSTDQFKVSLLSAEVLVK